MFTGFNILRICAVFGKNTQRLILRGFTKDDALWTYHIWNDPEMGKYLPDEAKEDIDEEYLKELEHAVL